MRKKAYLELTDMIFTGTLVKDLQDLVDTHLKWGFTLGEDETHISTLDSEGMAPTAR